MRSLVFVLLLALSPRHLTGIEVYAGANTPLEFQRALSGRGALVIWTK